MEDEVSASFGLGKHEHHFSLAALATNRQEVGVLLTFAFEDDLLVLGDVVDADRSADAVAVLVAELLVQGRARFELSLVELDRVETGVDGASRARLFDAARFAVAEGHGSGSGCCFSQKPW